MNARHSDRRDFLKKLGMISVGSAFGVALPKRGLAADALEVPFRRVMNSMGGLVSIDVFGEKEAQAREAIRDAFAEIRLIDELMSTHREFSQLSRLNKAAGNDMVEADPRLLEVLRASLRWSGVSGGEFDVTTLPLLKAWGFRPDAPEMPPSVEEARKLVSFREIEIGEREAGLKTARGGIDLGAIAKGYAIDRGAKVLREKWGIRKAIVEAAGDLYCIGHPDDAAGWRIGLKNPAGDGICATFELRDMAVSTSGNYEGTIERDGREICDKFTPTTGNPVENFLSVSACAANCMDADAASTALFIAGRKLDPAMRAAGVTSLYVTGKPGALEFSATEGFPEYRRVG